LRVVVLSVARPPETGRVLFNRAIAWTA